MKVLSIIFTLLLWTTVSAEILPERAHNFEISHVLVGEEVITVSVSYSTSSIAEDQYFEVNFVRNSFSEQEISALSAQTQLKILKAAREIFDLEIILSKQNNDKVQKVELIKKLTLN